MLNRDKSKPARHPAAGLLRNSRGFEGFAEEDLQFIEALGKRFFPIESWQHLSDDEIMRLSDHETGKGETEISLLGEEIKRMLRKWIPQLLPENQGNDFKWLDIWVVLTAAARISLAEERLRRLAAQTSVPSPSDTRAAWWLPEAV